MKRDPTTSVKYLPWESFSTDDLFHHLEQVAIMLQKWTSCGRLWEHYCYPCSSKFTAIGDQSSREQSLKAVLRYNLSNNTVFVFHRFHLYILVLNIFLLFCFLFIVFYIKLWYVSQPLHEFLLGFFVHNLLYFPHFATLIIQMGLSEAC